MKRFIKLSWKGIPIGIIATVLLGITVVAGTLIGVTQTITQEITPAPIQYTLTMEVDGNGVTTPAVGTHSYLKGTTVNISANPDSGWKFVNWTGDVADVSSASTTVTMNADKTITAHFELLPVYGSIMAPDIDLPNVEVGKTFGLVTGNVTVVVGPDMGSPGTWLHIRLDDTTIGDYDMFGANIRSEAGENPMNTLVTIGVTYSSAPGFLNAWEMSTLLTVPGTYTFREFVCGTAGSTIGVTTVKLDFTLEDVPYVIP